MKNEAVLHFFCGKAAAGKTTLSKQIACAQKAILISEDIWLSKLYPDEIESLSDYVNYSARLKIAIFEHVTSLLRNGISVVLDFPGNTKDQRYWFRTLYENVGCSHVMHYIEASDALCKQQLNKRNQELPDGSSHLSDEFFDLVTSYFQVPSSDEGFNIEKYAKN